ncbi:hypothetical protein FBY21_2719 [Pseudomonas sp. SLBN-26]|nr:hypothetical protein [Pseudomonas otitidis]TQL07339.1 hypothetical protein FBY21_2719 [Pseudomonas sp. SLBN-26]
MSREISGKGDLRWQRSRRELLLDDAQELPLQATAHPRL